MQTQRGIAMTFIAGEEILSALNANGVGKAVVYGDVAGEVLEGTEDAYADFAGVIEHVSAMATVNRTNPNVNQGARDVAEGDAVSVYNDHVMEVLMDGQCSYGDFLTLADDGKFQALSVSATPTAPETMQIVGRALDDCGAKDTTVLALIWVRK